MSGEGVSEAAAEGLDRSKFLAENKLKDAEKIFVDRDVEIEELVEFTKEELDDFGKDIGLDTLQRKRLIKAIDAIRPKKAVAAPIVTPGISARVAPVSAVPSYGGSSVFSSSSGISAVVVSPAESKALKKLDTRLTKVTQLVGELEKCFPVLEQRKEQCKVEAKDRFGQINAQLSEKKSVLLKDVAMIRAEKEEKLKLQGADLAAYQKSILEAKKKYENLMSDSSMDTQTRKQVIAKMVDDLVANRPQMVLVTQPNLKLSYNEHALSNYLSQLGVDDCDQPSAPKVTVSKVTATSAKINWEMSGKDLQKGVLGYAIEIAAVKGRVKNKSKGDYKSKKSKKKSKKSKKKSKKKRRKHSTDSEDSSDSSDSSDSDDSDSSDSSDSESDDSDSDNSDSDKDSDASDSESKSDDSDDEKVDPKNIDISREKYAVEESDDYNDEFNADLDLPKKLEWRKLVVLGGKKLKKNGGVKSPKFSIKDLKDEHVYYVRVRAKNSSGWGRYNGPYIKIHTTKMTLESKILKSKEREKVFKWLSKSDRRKKIKLLYRGSKHGYACNIFHQKCDNKGTTLCIVESTNGHVFGGYTAVPWTMSSGYKVDNAAWIFVVRSKRKHGTGKYTHKANGTNAVYHNTSYGPVFGSGFDWYVANNCNTNTSSYANGGTSFSCPQDNTFIAGTYNYMVKDYECFQIGK